MPQGVDGDGRWSRTFRLQGQIGGGEVFQQVPCLLTGSKGCIKWEMVLGHRFSIIQVVDHFV